MSRNMSYNNNVRNESETICIQTVPGVYIGDRGFAFKSLIKGLLKASDISERYVDILVSEKNMELYGAAFTSDLVDDNNNYQIYEQLGDLSCNKFIVSYIYTRFPFLKSCDGVKIAARLRINYGSKKSFFEIAEKLGFWEYITAPNDIRQRNKKPLLEDSFEAFIGVTEYILDSEFGIGVGYACVYIILEKIFSSINISLKYSDLYDAKTRLKELFDFKMDMIGVIEYIDSKEGLMNTSYVYQKKDGVKKEMGKGTAALKSDAQQIAAENALSFLKRNGIYKPVPELYRMINGESKEENKDSEVNVNNSVNTGVNTLVYVKNKCKYQYKYYSTPLILSCRERNFKKIKMLLEKGADINITDSHEMTAIDCLLIGKYRPKLIERVINEVVKNEVVKKKIRITKKVYEKYGVRYEKLMDKEFKNKIEIV